MDRLPFRRRRESVKVVPEPSRTKIHPATSTTHEDDLFLELAKDTNADCDVSSLAEETRRPESRRVSSPASAAMTPPVVPSSAFNAQRSKQYPPSLSSNIASPPPPPSTAPPVSSERYFRSLHHQSSLSPEYRRASAGEVNVSMRPFRPSYRPSQLSAQAFNSPRSADSGYSEVAQSMAPSPATPAYADGVESVGSVTAVSTVWDDAEDLKTKIKQYRSTSRRIRSSGADIQPDRPRTSTTMTTNSSMSHPSAHLNPSVIEASAKHQLLRKALQRLQGHVVADVYRSLEASVADVISASSVLEMSDTASIADNESIITGKGSSDRRLRRRIDSLCQSLTDICIALRDSQDHTATLLQSPELPRPTSNGSASRTARETPSPVSYLEERRARIGSASRAPSRVGETPEPTASPQDSRSSMASRQAQARPRRLSIADRSPTTYLSPHSLAASSSTRTLSHTGSAITLSGPLSPVASSSGRTSTVRAPSRAATEAASPSTTAPSSYLMHRHHSARDRDKKGSRDYIDHHPMPEAISPSMRKTLAANQSNGSLNSAYSAATYAGAGEAGGHGGGGRSTYLQERLDKKRREQAEMLANGPSGALGTPGSSGRRSRTAKGADRERRPMSRGLSYG